MGAGELSGTRQRFDGNGRRDAQADRATLLALKEMDRRIRPGALESLKKDRFIEPSARDWAAVLKALTAGTAPDDAAVDRCVSAWRFA
jgi:hypothetical protein